VYDGNIGTPTPEVRQGSFASAFRTARYGAAEHLLIVNVLENERDIAVNAEPYVARTGADRLRNAARNIAEQPGAALPFRAVLLRRTAGEGERGVASVAGDSEDPDDRRKGYGWKRRLTDAVKRVFAAFFFRHPSLPDFQQAMQRKRSRVRN
jgi:hypothetical protein